MPVPRFGLLTYQANPEYNVGDYIQSLAAKQFLPQVDQYLCREKLSQYKNGNLKLILNGWFMHHPSNWPPSENIDPLVVSFHLNSQAKEQMLNAEGATWFRNHAPVGCRDTYTLQSFQEAGIPAYLSGCLTTTFRNPFNYRTDDVYFTDVLFRVPGWSTVARTPREFIKSIISGDIIKSSRRSRVLRKLFDEELLKNAITLEHYHTSRHSEKERFEMAECFLQKYATAKLVVTSRLHCALPCLAFGTPVIFVDGGFTKTYDKCRLDGTTNLFNTICVDDEDRISANFALPEGKISGNTVIENPELFRQKAETLRQNCEAFIHSVALPA